MAVRKTTGGNKSTKPAAAVAMAKGASEVIFRCVAPAEARVFVAGTFNGWSTEEHALKFDARNGCFQAKIPLAAGRYEYKFVVDGTWVADPACPDWVPNEHGSLNSVIMVS
jgi:1,4-alpha-glucan branching enzyme